MSKLPVAGSFVNHQYDRYLRMKFDLGWRWVRNPSSHRSFTKHPPILNSLQKRIVDDLNRDGYAICHFDDLLETPGLWQRLSDQESAFRASDEVQSSIRSRQEAFNKAKDPNAVSHYIMSYYPEDRKSVIDSTSPLFELAIHPRVVDVVNSYLALWSRLIYFDMWHTLPMDTGERILSQRWHRDPEDRKKIRTFLYFVDVDEQAGAMEYFAGSQMGGQFQNVFPWHDPISTPYPPQEELDRRIPPSNRIVLKGPPGTLVFCDTAGFHRGGIARTKPRILATAAYVTPASLHGRRYNISTNLQDAQSTAACRFAVS